MEIRSLECDSIELDVKIPSIVLEDMSITYEKDRKQVERFDTPDSDNIIELNGIKSELVICVDKEGRLTK